MISDKFNISIALFFGAFLAIGLYCISYTGISWDEPAMREYGLVLYDYVNGIDDELLNHHERYHGPFFELVLIYLENGMNLTETADIYHMRHVTTFLVCTLGLWFFYLLSVEFFKNRWLAFLSLILVATPPRIFSNLLYNSKDTVFMALFIMSIWALLKAYEKRSRNWMFFQAFLVAIAITVRILGVLIPAISMFVLIFMPVVFSKKVKIGIQYSFVLLTCVIAFWPVLWPSPFEQLIASFEHMRQFPWDDFSLFEETFATPTDMPWYYLPKWVLMTSPLLQVLLMLLGPVVWLGFRKNSPFKWAILIWAVAPLVAIIGLDATVYDTWRHIYFIYPAWIIMGVGVVHAAKEHVKMPLLRKAGVALICLAIGTNLIWSAVNHRNLQCYFNPLFKTNASLNYDYDFWGLSYLEGLEWIMEQNPSGYVKLSVANAPGFYNCQMLPQSDQKRIEFVSRDSADYFLSNFRFPVHFEPYQKGEYPYQNLVFEVKVDGNRALGVYQPNK
ncbi:glycosyltransferase family 39 protein [Flavobacteriales bacterium]|nr:glycosyltransferase family 39 protein [Flavobacteriales bacterium]